MSIDHAFDDAVATWRAEVGANELIQQLDALDDDDRARLATDVAAHCVTLTRALGEIPARWMPRSAVRATQRLAGGNVVLRDVVDLMIGASTSDVASIALFDVTTSPLGEGAERSMRFHALMAHAANVGDAVAHLHVLERHRRDVDSRRRLRIAGAKRAGRT